MKQQVKISKVKGNPSNPRIIKNDKFKKLVKSIQEFPEMLKLRPIVVDEDMMVLGGNMRLKASKEAGLKEVWIDIAEGLTEDQKKEFIVKDNASFGEWDWDILANEWESENLDDWGINLPNFWDQEENILDANDIKKTDYLSIVVVAYENVEDLDKITSLYELNSIDITEDIKSNITSQRKVYVFKK
jgi:hypothetical protein